MEVFGDNVVKQRWECVPGRLLAGGFVGRCGIEGLPRPERNHETKPREKEHPAMYADNIKQRHRASLVVDGVEIRGFPERCRTEADHLALVYLLNVGRWYSQD